MKRIFQILGAVLLILTGAILFGGILLGSCLLIKSPTRITYEGHAQNLKELKISNDFALSLLSEFIPCSAKDIRYQVFPYVPYGKTVFVISGDDFESWLSQKMTEWKLEKKSNPIFGLDEAGERKQVGLHTHSGAFTYTENGNKKEIWVKSEFYFRGRRRENSSIEIIYDEQQKLCYIQF
jgi:hypothetical protein